VDSAEAVVEHPSGERAPRLAGSASGPELPAGTVEVVPVRALLLGERLDTRSLERNEPLAVAPLAVDIPEGGVAVAFRYGAVILFGAATPAMDDFVASLTPLVTGALPVPERDDVRLLVRPDADQHVDLAGNIFLREKTIERLQLVADILAKSLVHSHYETRTPRTSTASSRLPRHCERRGAPGDRARSCCATLATCF
jgi:uncharacterized Rmd1/YagE family protein